MRKLLDEKKEEREEVESRNQNIINDDRLWYVETMLSDDVKTIYCYSQDVLMKSELSYGNYVICGVIFYGKIIEVFNNSPFVPETQVLPDLYERFVVSWKLPFGRLMFEKR